MSDTDGDEARDVVCGGNIETLLAHTEGMTSVREARLLYEFARAVRTGCIVEIGAYRGRSTIALGRGSLDGYHVPVFTIEPHQTFQGVLGGRFGPEDAVAFYRAMLDSGCCQIVRLISLSSEYVTARWLEPVSLLWIDGDHRYEGVRRDFDSWRPHLVRGATIIFDDASDPTIGPYMLIQELLADRTVERVRELGKIAVVRFL